MHPALIRQIVALLSPLRQEVRLLADQGHSVFPDDGSVFYMPADLPVGTLVQERGYCFWRLSDTPGYTLAALGRESTADVLHLTAAAIAALADAHPPEPDILSAYHSLLTDDLDAESADGLIQRFGIAPAIPRYVLYLRIPRTAIPAYQVLRELVPLEEHDVLVDIDQRSAVLVRSQFEDAEPEETEEFARALQETLREEAGMDMLCGLSDTVLNAHALREGYLQARHALDLGLQYQEKESVFVWSRILLPRVLSEINPEQSAQYHGLLFNRRTASLFSEDMLSTIDMFMRKDLNLSDTARQLYIHRNTLVYRLDKVQRLTGLDLRRFDDAFVYRLLYELRHNIPKESNSGQRGRRKA
jgi:carbohydrate diacid regulator